jgi:hypothetical protein
MFLKTFCHLETRDVHTPRPDVRRDSNETGEKLKKKKSGKLIVYG